MLRTRALPAGFIAPCLPTKTDKLPSGSQWSVVSAPDQRMTDGSVNGRRGRLLNRTGISGQQC